MERDVLMAKKRFYAVVKGYAPGIYQDWNSCEKSIHGFSGQKYKGFSNENDAIEWYRDNGGDMELLAINSIAKNGQEDLISQAVSSETESVVRDDKDDLIAKLNKKLSINHNTGITKEFEDFCIKYPQYAYLSISQKIAAQTITGKSLLFAVPGSGKTTVLIAHAGFLIYGQKSQHITPNMLMNLTFTVPAAREMSERFKREFHPLTNEQPAFMTIHSFCWREVIPALRKRGYTIPCSLINTDKKENQNAMVVDNDEDDIEIPKWEKDKDANNYLPQSITSYGLLKTVLKRFKLSARDETIREKVSSLITSIKNRQLNPEDYLDKVISIGKKEYAVTEIYEAYQDELKKNKCMDFDDMLQYSLLGLQSYPDVLEELRNQYSYWSIDETQDNSKLQNMLLSLLVGDDGNLFVVGDDDQSIYNFRGAEPTLLLNYGTNDIVKAMVLDTNYRSASLIVKAAKNFIEENINRADKKMSARNGADKGEINFIADIPSEQHQYRYIVETARNCSNKGKSLAIIYRQNASAVPLMFWLLKAKIKFHIAKDYQELAFSKVFRDVINIMTLAINPGHWEAFNSCRYTLKIFIPKDTLENMSKYIKDGYHVQSILDWVIEKHENLRPRIELVKDILRHIKSESPFEAAKYIFETVLRNGITSTPSATERLCEYAMLSACTPFSSIAEFLSMHSILLDYAKNDNELDSSITLTSMHSSKGLEFDHVIIIDAWEEIMCGEQAKSYNEFSYEDREEPRRIFYVAITRAKNTLEFLIPQKYFGNEEIPCRFIVDLMQSCGIYETNSMQHVLKQISESNSTFVFHQPQVYYGVRKGYRTGVFDNWAETEQAVSGYSGQEYKKFYSIQEAKDYCGDIVDT